MMTRKLYHHFAPLIAVLLLVSGCAQEPPVTTPVKLIMFGDSLTDGYKIPTEQSVPARIQALFLADGHTGVRVMNMGISGDTTHGGVSRLNLVLNQSPDIVVLELGANDLLRRLPAEKARQNLAVMIEAMQQRGITVILAGVKVPGVFNVGNPQVAEYSPMFDGLAREYGLPYYPNFLEGTVGKSRFMQDDQLHPNADGAQEIAERLYPLVLKVTREVAGRKAQG